MPKTAVTNDIAWDLHEKVLLSPEENWKSFVEIVRFFKQIPEGDLERLIDNPRHSIALHAIYFTSLRRLTDEAEFGKLFADGVEARLNAKCPPWFRVVLDAMTQDDGRQVFAAKNVAVSPRERPAFSSAEMYLEFDHISKNITVSRNTGSRNVYPHDATISPSGLAISGASTDSCLFACVYSDMSPGGHKVCCIDKESERLKWTVPVRESNASGNGHTIHHLSLVPAEKKLIVFSVFSSTIFIDVLEIDTGKVVGRFSSLLPQD